MRVVVLFERSGVVAHAFVRRGHTAVSVDVRPPADDHPLPLAHRQCDAIEYLDRSMWRGRPDLIIAHPPCTALCSAGNRHYADTPERDAAVESVVALADALSYHTDRWVIENPVGVLSTRWRRPDQYIQPYEHGDPYSKKTGLWLHGLPTLTPSHVLPLPSTGRWVNQTASGQSNEPDTKGRSDRRSVTYPGVARAMAEQWG